MNNHLLKINLTPAEYQQVDPGFHGPTRHSKAYWGSLPEYLLARCPLCAGTYTALLDTYSLRHWLRPVEGQRVFDEMYQSIDCSHFVRAHHFINLNGVVPTELRYIRLGAEVPCVMPDFLTDDVESYGVMHALPICRVEAGRFVPRYSLYTITYYSSDHQLSYAHRWKKWKQEHHFPPFMRLPPRHDPESETWWDLALWVKKRRLVWLDPSEPDLPLRSGPVEAFPYANVTGSREPTTYRDGKLS